MRVNAELNADNNDSLSIRDQGTGTANAGYSSLTNVVTHGGEPIANVSGSASGLVVTFFSDNITVTPAIVQKVLRNITYKNTATRLDQRPRFVRISVQELPATGYFSSSLYRRITLDMNPGNAAPVVNATSPTLAPVLEDDTDPPGQAVLSFTNGGVTDAHIFDPKGIAVTGLANAEGGTWQYSVTEGDVWQKFGNVSFSSALLLRETDLVRFVPAPNANGTATISYRAWDQSTDLFGSVLDLTGKTGGANAFNSGSQTATIAITPVNDAPSFTKGADQLVDEDSGTKTVSDQSLKRIRRFIK